MMNWNKELTLKLMRKNHMRK